MQAGASKAGSQGQVRHVDGDESDAHLVEHVQEVLQSLQTILGLVAGRERAVGHLRIASRRLDEYKGGLALGLRPDRAAVVDGSLRSTDDRLLLALGHSSFAFRFSKHQLLSALWNNVIFVLTFVQLATDNTACLPAWPARPLFTDKLAQTIYCRSEYDGN